MKKVAFYTLGCKLNFSETSTLARQLQDEGFQKVEFTDTPDVFIINTCSVTDNADKKCKKIVRDAKAISPHAYVAIVGCYAQLKPHEIAAIPGVDAVLGANEKFKITELLKFERQDKPVIYHRPIEEVCDFHTSYSLQDRTRSFLKVQDGCDYSCSFCTIPLARGKSRSDSIAEIVKQAHQISESGVKEIVLTGVNIGDFGLLHGERKESFFQLIQALEEVNVRFRISSIEPNLLTDEMIGFIAGSEKFLPHFHIPLQSGSNKILRLMRRRYQRDVHTSRVERIQSLMPHACVGADVIVGFPGETKEDFLETYNYLSESQLSYLHVFTYSERANTEAVKMPDRIHSADRSERSQMLHILSEKMRRRLYQQQVGKVVNVLFENDYENDFIHGHSENYVRVGLPANTNFINQVVPVRITSFTPHGAMTGELV